GINKEAGSQLSIWGLRESTSLSQMAPHANRIVEPPIRSVAKMCLPDSLGGTGCPHNPARPSCEMARTPLCHVNWQATKRSPVPLLGRRAALRLAEVDSGVSRHVLEAVAVDQGRGEPSTLLAETGVGATDGRHTASLRRHGFAGFELNAVHSISCGIRLVVPVGSGRNCSL